MKGVGLGCLKSKMNLDWAKFDLESPKTILLGLPRPEHQIIYIYYIICFLETFRRGKNGQNQFCSVYIAAVEDIMKPCSDKNKRERSYYIILT